jgi:hypothetical protein
MNLMLPATMTARTKSRMARNVVLVLIATLAVAAFATMRWDVAWGAVHGDVGAPDATIQVPASTAGSEPDVRLAVLGDVGTGDTNEWGTANLVTQAAKSDPFDGLVLLGDNVYPDGDPSRLGATVFDPFAPILDQGTALLPVLGNHDVQEGHANGQVTALGMPGRWYATDIGSVLFIALDSNLVGDPDQLHWLESTLAAKKAPWVIVATHHPAYSAGYHGSDRDVQETWVPIFERYRVDLVLSGHDHDYQRIEPIQGVTYIVSGGGSKIRPTGRTDFTAYAASVLHFLDIAIWEDRLEVTAFSAEGAFDRTVIDRTTSTSAAEPTWPNALRERIGGIEPGGIRNGLAATILGAALWALTLLVGWVGPPFAVARNEHIVFATMSLGMLTTVAGVTVVLAAVLA